MPIEHESSRSMEKNIFFIKCNSKIMVQHIGDRMDTAIAWPIRGLQNSGCIPLVAIVMAKDFC